MEGKNRFPFCSILVLNYNGKEHIQECLSSLISQTYPNYEIILVDNASTDSSLNLAKEKFPQIKVVRNKVNQGTAGGFNFGARYAKGEYLLFLANDLVAEEDLLEKLIQSIAGNIQICSAKMLDYYNRDIIDYAGIKMDIFGFPKIIGHKEKDSPKYNKVYETIPTGTVLLIKRVVFEKVGGFDPDNFTLGDELDLWWRIKLLGYKCVYNPEAVIYHKGRKTLKKFKRAQLRFLSEKNTIRNLIKNYSSAYLFPILSIYFLSLFVEIVFYLLIGKSNFVISTIKAINWNFRNLSSSLKLRRIVQIDRNISDSELLKIFHKGSYKLNMFYEWLKGDIKI